MDKKSVYGIRKSKATAEKQPKAYQSRSYNQQFEGYTYRTTLDSKGRKKLERVYDGVYYQAAGSAKMGFLRKIGYVLLYALSLGMLVGYGKSTFRSPWATVLVIPEMATLFSLIWLGLKLIFYVTAPGKMTIGEYKSSCLALQTATKWAASFWGIVLLLFALSLCFSGESIASWGWPGLALLAGSSTTTTIYALEKRVSYETVSANK